MGIFENLFYFFICCNFLSISIAFGCVGDSSNYRVSNGSDFIINPPVSLSR